MAADLASAAAERLERVLTDNGSEFRSGVFGDTVRELGANTDLHPGGPTSNGTVRSSGSSGRSSRSAARLIVRAEPGAQADRADP